MCPLSLDSWPDMSTGRSNFGFSVVVGGMSDQRLASCKTLVEGTEMLGTNHDGSKKENMDLDALIKAPESCYNTSHAHHIL